MRARWAILAVIIAICAVAYLTVRNSSNTNRIGDDIERLKQATVSPHSTLLDSPDQRLENRVLTVNWRVETQEDWKGYVESVAARMPSEFHRSPATVPTFTRILSGDEQIIELQRETTELPLRVRITFKSFPD